MREDLRGQLKEVEGDVQGVVEVQEGVLEGGEVAKVQVEGVLEFVEKEEVSILML